jgi:flagellar biosynthesis protein FliP
MKLPREMFLPKSRRLSGIVWLGLIVSCLAFCSRGLCAQSKDRTKTGSPGRVTSNSPSPDGVAEVRRPRAPRDSKNVRQDESATEDSPAATSDSGFPASFQPEQLIAPGGLGSTINLMAVVTVLSLAPSILIMTTCFIRFIIVRHWGRSNSRQTMC